MSTSAPPDIRILLVEDNEHDRIAFRRAFKKSAIACRVTECVRAEEALDKIHDQMSSFDIGVVDHGLPGMSGLALCRRILMQKNPLPLIILTGKGSEELAVEALKAGVDDYMIKDPGQHYLTLLPVVVTGVLGKHADRRARKQAEEALRKAHDELERRVEERTASLTMATDQLKRELSERMRTEAALRLSEERFRSVAQTAGDAIITVDGGGEIVFWNHAAEKIFGYSAEEATGRGLTTIMPQRFIEAHKEGLRRVVSSDDFRMLGKTIEMVGLRKDKIEFPVELSLAKWLTREGVFVTGIVRDITDRKQAEQEIRHLSHQLIRVSEEEKKRLARDLHDEFGQALTALYFSVEALDKSLPDQLQEHKRKCDELMQLVQMLGDNIRRVASELRPDMLDDLGLVPTMKWYIDDFGKRIGDLRIDFHATGMKKRPGPEIEIVIYRVLQETLNNIAKHARASRVNVVMAYSHPKLIFTIKDNGIGFGPDGTTRPMQGNKGIGLLGIRERVESVSGHCEIRSNKGRGTMIRVELPLNLEPQ